MNKTFEKLWKEFVDNSRVYPNYIPCPECNELTAIPVDYLEYHEELECLNCHKTFKNQYWRNK